MLAQRVFPPRGDVVYEGIGIATEKVDGKVFVTSIEEAVRIRNGERGDSVL